MLQGWKDERRPFVHRGTEAVWRYDDSNWAAHVLHWLCCPKPLHSPCLTQKPSLAHLPFHEISFATQMLYPFLKTNTLLLSFKAWNMTMRVRRPLKGTLRKKIRSYATESKKVKKTRKPNCSFCSCAHKKLNQSRKGYQNMRQSQRRRQNQKRR